MGIQGHSIHRVTVKHVPSAAILLWCTNCGDCIKLGFAITMHRIFTSCAVNTVYGPGQGAQQSQIVI
jgi:hypothetical protein